MNMFPDPQKEKIDLLSARIAELTREISGQASRVQELLAANTREVERRRRAEAVLATVDRLLRDVTTGFTQQSAKDILAAKLALIEALEFIEKGDFE